MDKNTAIAFVNSCHQGFIRICQWR